MQWVLNPDASAFYEAAGSAAAALGVTVSVFAASARTCGLNAIQALVDHSGGCLRLYPALQQAAMPQVCLYVMPDLGHPQGQDGCP